MASSFQFKQNSDLPVVIAGPCTAESEELVTAVSSAMHKLSQELKFQYVFKASFDKANRTSSTSFRGQGLPTTLKWFSDLKARLGVPVLTDIHEVVQVAPAAEVCDVLQIPAFLCRQTDLLVAAVQSGRAVNVKKGQFLAPEGTAHIVNKAKAVCNDSKKPLNLALTERGVSFGYGNLVVDMRGFPVMAALGVPVIFDITHSTQQPSTSEVTGGDRRFAPVLARSALATGYLDGFFLEVHTDPKKAKSDAAVQLSITQAETLLRQIVPLWKDMRQASKNDNLFSQ